MSSTGERQPLLSQKAHHDVEASASSSNSRGQDSAAPPASQASVIDWIAFRTANLTRKEVIATTFFATFVGTLLLASGLINVSSLPPRGEVNYAALTNQLELLRKDWETQ
ncbi:hypothetical protein HDU96_011139, partial [Phlyctochytrium bullatum]